MEIVLVAGWLVVAALLLGPPLLGVHRSAWSLRSPWTPESVEREEGAADAGLTPVGTCRVCGADGQAGYTYCQSCLTPLPQPEEGIEAESREGRPAD